jgi:hypothetical protein
LTANVFPVQFSGDASLSAIRIAANRFPSAGTLAGIAEKPKDLQLPEILTRPRIASPHRQIVLAISS